MILGDNGPLQHLLQWSLCETSGQQQQQQPYATSSIGHGPIHGPPGSFPNCAADRRPSTRGKYSNWHLTGFTFYNGDPMLSNRDVFKFLQKPSFLPHHKSRGDVDSYLRFETNLRILFEAVVFFDDFWGLRGFWYKIRDLLRLASVSSDTLEETVKLYCEGRRDCRKKLSSVGGGKPLCRIAELADIVNGLRQGEHAPITQTEWDRRLNKWRSKLGWILNDQGVHNQQFNNGTCAPELLEHTSPNFIPTSPRADTQRRVRFDLRQPFSPPRRPSLEEPRRPRDDEVPQAQAARNVPPPKPPAPQSPPKLPQRPLRSTEQAYASGDDTTTNGSCEKLPNSTPAKPPNHVQSLDELVLTYKGSPASTENSRKRSRDELPEEADTANKRIATGLTGESPRLARTTVLAPIVTGLGTPCEDIDSGIAVTSPQHLTPQQANEKPADLQANEDVTMDVTEVVESREKPQVEAETPADQLEHDDTSEAAMAGTPDRTISPAAESESLFVEKSEFQEEEEAGASQSVVAMKELLYSLEQRQVQLEKLEASVDSQKEQLEQWALDRKRLAELEAQMQDRANDTSRIRSLQKVTEAHGDILKHQSSNSRRLEDKLVEKLTEAQVAMDMHKKDEEIARAATTKLTRTLQAELKTKYTTDEEFFRITHGHIEETKKRLNDEKANSGNRYLSLNKRCDGIHQEIRDAEKRLQNQLEQHSNDCKAQRAETDKSSTEDTAMKAQVAELQKQLGERAKTDETTEARLSDLWRQLGERAMADRSTGETAIKDEVAELQKQLGERVKADEATETRLADLQRQLGQVQEALQARETTTPQALQAPPPPPAPPAASSFSNCLDPGSLARLDDGTFLDAMYFEMAKLRTAMRTRIHAMDAHGVPDEDNAKLAVSDISFELGRVLDVARKRINKL
ncbi:hypothetical protein PG999_014238 [Apiospora kogelbergensis]|uniref:Uncharacterized protein n=1 Tax=Apiospora kogelbergensis TaxID=1337665 RepID=A0AAW0Q6M4_9PEZI